MNGLQQKHIVRFKSKAVKTGCSGFDDHKRGGVGKADFREWIKADFREWSWADSNYAASQRIIFHCLRLPIQSNPGGCDLNAMLGS